MRKRLTRRLRDHEKTRTSGHNRSDRSGLTPREEQILFWIAQGKSNADVARILEIKAATVGKHLEHIYPKLGVENRTAAASFVPQRGP